MILPTVRSLGRDESGAVSSMYAVAILTLVAMAGIGFDYGRMVALDTELQNAADQAALAAATQLDGGSDAMVRARNAATNAFAAAASPYVNETRFANDNAGRPITSLSFKFYEDYKNDSTGTEVVDDTDGADAKVVEVTVNTRTVNYALTPLVGAIRSNAIGRAMASLENATCNVAPVFFCVPNDSSGNPIRTFPTTANIGDGLELHFKQNQTNTDADDGGTDWRPGNFGFLDVPWGTGSEKTRRLGLNTAVAGCFEGSPSSRTGYKEPEGDALNTRLDLYNSPINPNSCDGAGNYCPAQNVRKNFVHKESFNSVPNDQINTKTCSSSPDSNNWITWDTAKAEATSFDPQEPGYPKDTCFDTPGGCTVNGDGTWDASGAWINYNLGVGSIPDLDGNGRITRWEAYQYELSHPNSPKKVGMKVVPKNANNSSVDLYCSYPQPIQNTGIPASNSQKDRRILTAAAVDCTELNGKKQVDILQWVDLFLVRGVASGGGGVFFMEIKGPGQRPDGGSGFQYFGRRKAVLIR